MADLTKLSKEELSEFLSNKGFDGDLIQLLQKQDIDGEVLFTDLSEKDFIEMKITVGHRKKLLKLIQQYHDSQQHSLEPPPFEDAPDGSQTNSHSPNENSGEIVDEPNTQESEDISQRPDVTTSSDTSDEFVDLENESYHRNMQITESLSRSYTEIRNAVSVTLNAIVPAYSWGWDTEGCSLVVCFGAEELGGWSSANIQFEQKIITTNGYIVFSGTLSIAIDVIQKYKHLLSYKYAVATVANVCSSYERIHHTSIRGTKIINRVLKIPKDECHSGGTLTHYDTIIYPDEPLLLLNKRIIRERVSAFLRLSREHEIEEIVPDKDTIVRRRSLEIHLVKFHAEIVNGNILNNGASELAYVCREIGNIYDDFCSQTVEIHHHNEQQRPEYRDLKIDRSSLKEVMYEWLAHIIVSTKKHQSSDEENIEHFHSYVLSGAVLAYLSQHFDVFSSFLTKEECQNIAELLQLQPAIGNDDQRSCPGYDMLLKSIPQNEFKKKLKTAVSKVCQHIISKSQGKNSTWLMAIPLFHFLADLSEPYKPLPHHHAEIKWSFWEVIKKEKSHFIDQFNEQHKFEHLWRSYIDQITLDPVLSKVLTFLCPLNELHTVLSQLPPIVGTSFLIQVILKQDKKFKEKLEQKQLQQLKDWLNAIKTSVQVLNDDEWQTQGVNVFLATTALTETVLTRIQSTSAHHIEALLTLLEHLFHILSGVCDHKLLSPSSGMRNISDLLNMNWLKHFNVIGGNCFGGTNGQKWKEELIIWKSAFAIKCPDNLEPTWSDVLKEILEARTQLVDNEKKVSMFLKLNPKDKEYHQVIVDLFIRMGIQGLEEEKSAEILMKGSSGQAEHVAQLLSIHLKEHCDSVGVFQYGKSHITLEELLSWRLWPTYITLCSNNDPVFRAMEDRQMTITASACSKILSITNEIVNGSISLQDLKTILEHRITVELLMKASSSIIELDMYANRLKNLEEHITAVQLFHQHMFSGVEGYNDIEMQLRETIEDKPMNTLCKDWEGAARMFVRCDATFDSPALGVNSPLYSVLKQFAILAEKCRSDVFRRKWWMHVDNLKRQTEVRSKRKTQPVSQEEFLDKVWRQTVNDCRVLLETCVDGSAVVADVISKNALYNLESAEVKRNLLALRDGLMECFPSDVPPAPKGEVWTTTICRQIEYYQLACRCSVAALHLVKLKDCLKRTGKHKIITDLAKKGEVELSKYKLKDIDDDFILAGEAMKEVSAKNKCECLESLTENWEVVQWIMESCKDIDQLQAFVDVALYSAAEDHLTTQKLTALRIVGNAVATFIDKLREAEQAKKPSFWNRTRAFSVQAEQDKSLELIQLCDNFWLALDQHPKLPVFLVECKTNLHWFQGIKDAQGDVHQSTLEELSVINSEGCFVIGKKGNDLLTSIASVFQLILTVKDKVYDLDSLHDLESRLVLLAGQGSENTNEVHKFLNVFHTICIIADTLVKLHAQGCVHFIGWEYRFHCGQDSIQQLREEQKHLSRQLKIWEEAVNTARNDCYPLNSFTVQQLLLLRKELVPKYYHNGEYKDVLHPQAITLLKYLFPCTGVKALVSTVKCSWELLEEPVEEQLQAKENEVIAPQTNESASGPLPKTNGLTCEQIVETMLTEFEQTVYTTLTTITGYNSVWVIAEILQRNPRATDQTKADKAVDEISDKILEMSNNDDEPDQKDLVDIVNESLSGQGEIQLEAPEVLTTASDDVESEHSDEDSKSVQSDSLCNKATVADMLEMRSREYLSLNQLSKLLSVFQSKLQVENPLQESRRITGIDIATGSPNLFVTEDEYVIPTTLTMYASDEKKPLPTQEEVLVCNEETTAEQVILFWRRSIFDPEFKRIFCLVHGEKLSYSVCEQALRDLAKLKQGKVGYRLIIVCSSESEKRSHLVTSLHSFKRSNPDTSPEALKMLKSYLQTHLIKPKYTSIGTPQSDQAIFAHSVDPQGSYARIIWSARPGMGKSLCVKRMGEIFQQKADTDSPILSIPIHGPIVEIERILENLCQGLKKIIHFDIAPSMVRYVTSFIFSVLVLGHLSDHKGRAWRRELAQMYCIEMTVSKGVKKKVGAIHQLLKLLPSAQCHPPTEEAAKSKMIDNEYNVGMDLNKLKDPVYQRVYHYLKEFADNKDLDNYKYSSSDVMMNPKQFLRVVLRHHSAKSWAELSHYIQFLNNQLVASEQSIFCNLGALGGGNWSGMKSFVVRMMIIMSKEFASSSLMGEHDVAEGLSKYTVQHSWNDSFHPYLFFNEDRDTITFLGFCVNKAFDAIDPATGNIIYKSVIGELLCNELRLQRVDLFDDYRKWQKDVLLTNLGRVIGLKVTKETPVKDPDSSYVITVDNVMKMMAILMRFRCRIPVVIMGETGCGKTRLLKYLCDLASQEFIKSGNKANFVVLKVHGGTKEDDIIKAVKKAEKLAEASAALSTQPAKQHATPVEGVFGTVLFFDEANTTEHINLIKEIMCDRTMFGEEIHKDLKIVVACNPYKRHTDEMITKLDKAGLGFYTKSHNAKERLGKIPLRELVYRVHKLPPSMLPLIFDFGRLDSPTEKKYIHKMVSNQISLIPIKEQEKKKFSYEPYIDPITNILSWSQEYMRNKKDECSFVSLRDIDRAMIVFRFFLEKIDIFGPFMDKKAKEMNYTPIKCKITRSLILTLAVCYDARLQVRQRYEREVVKKCSSPLKISSKEEDSFANELKCCQEVFLDNMKLGNNIARNAALRENVFMMLVCISVRIPLFLIGKPGSSKSLAKSIILNSMKGQNSGSELLKGLKEVQIFSYQCSQLSTSESIIKVFDQAKKVQDQSGDKSKFVSVVVLDEVGLAEDSPNLPLKVLHPLLEDGTEGNSYSIDVVEREERVAFIGISNWALDPAKMNRGIMVTRCDPTREELELSAKQICTNHGKDEVAEWLKPHFSQFAEAYLEILSKQKREFFGLRDFYSLVKMLYWMCKNAKEHPTWRQIEHVIRRNFGGFDEFDAIEVFKSKIHIRTEPPGKSECREQWRPILLKEHKDMEETKKKLFKRFKDQHWDIYKFKSDPERECYEDFVNEYNSGKLDSHITAEFEKFFTNKFDGELWPLVINPSCSQSGLVKASLANKERTTHGESRYLLFLTENYAALQTLQHFLESSEQGQTGVEVKRHKSPYVLFGSSFPKDKDFTQVCHNINTIKVCMETGRPVILLNLDHLYESLYDALNQYYVYFGDLRYVDLGLQNHRFKCIVHDDFKLILIAEKKKVYKEFPTPLINRLEKHFVVTSTILTDEQLKLEKELKTWVNNFTPTGKSFTPGDSFIGYQEDTPAAVVFRASKIVDCSLESSEWHEKVPVLDRCKYLLLQITTPDALIRLKKCAKLQDEYEKITKMYSKQQHSSLKDFLSHQFETKLMQYQHGCRMQVTTYNELLSVDEIEEIGKQLNFESDHVISCIIQEFDTQFEFSRKIREAFQMSRDSKTLLIVQCDSGHLDSDLIACAKYRVDDIREEQFHEIQDSGSGDIQPFNGCCHVLFTVLIPREHNKSSFVGFLGGDWICAHIDDFCPIYNFSSVNLALSNTPLSSLFYDPDLEPSHSVMPLEQQDDSSTDSLSSDEHAVHVNYCQNLYKLIQKAIQEASSDPESPLAKRFHTINMILYHLLTVHPPMKCAFYVQLVHHIWNYIKEREPHEEEWIIDAALDQSKLQEGGAFLQVLLRKLDEVVITSFAKIITFIDQANNLSLIDPTREIHPDVQAFWISAFGSSAICDFGYNTNEKSTKERNIQTQAPLYDNGCKFPFFWVIQQTVDKIMKDHQHLTTGVGEDNKLTIKLLTCFREHDIGLLLNRTPGRYMKLRYFNDLIQLTWPRTIKDNYVNTKESKLISAMLSSVADSLLQPYPEYTSFSDIICAFHFAIQLKSVEVTRFKELVSVIPEILEKMDLKNTSGLPLDVTAVILSLNVLDSVNKEQERWLISKLHRYHQVHHVIDTTIYSCEHESVVEKRPKWMAIQAVHMFIETVVMDHLKYFNKTVPYSNRVQMFMSRSGDFTKKSTLKKIELVLSQMYKEFSTTHQKDSEAFAQSCIRFYVEIISKLSMGKTAPEDELIEKLLDTVFTTGPEKEGLETKDLTPFLKSKNDSVPVVRSFLLQLLLQNNYERTREHIKTYFEKAQSTLTIGGYDVLIQLQILYSQLYEDSLFERHSNLDNKNKLQMLIQVVTDSKTRLLSLENQLTENENLTLEFLECVGGIRFALHHYTDWINDKYCRNATEDTRLHDRLQGVISELCLQKSLNTKTRGPQILLLKLLFRKCGETGFKKITADSAMSWVLPESVSTPSHVHLVDHFVIYGSIYCNEVKVLICEAVTDQIFHNLKSFKPKTPPAMVSLALSIFMEVTQTYTKAINDKTRVPGHVIQEIAKFVNSSGFSPDIKRLMSALVNNSFHGEGKVLQLFARPDQSLINRIYSSVVVHVAAGFIGKTDYLLRPFYMMLTNPIILEHAYLPAMPEDFAEDVRRLLGGQYYKCPNGHIYLITECGRPVEVKNCAVCGKTSKQSVPIGGTAHKLIDNNEVFIRDSKPDTGYILGVATMSSAVPERSLSPAACTIIKILMHSALLWTCCSKEELIEDVSKIVKTGVEKSKLSIFFWEHLTVDMQCLQRSLSIGFDDAALLIHIIMRRIVETFLIEDSSINTVSNLATSKSRNQWEEIFNQAYIQPVLKNVHTLLEDARKQILEDDKQNHPPILDIVYERNIVRPDLQHSLWKYRPNINLEHLSQKIQIEGHHLKHRALVFFLKEETSLRATKYLPSIVKLQRFLYDVHHYRSSEEEVQEKTVGQFLSEISNDETRNELKSMIQNVQQAWLLVRGKLQTYGRLPVPQEYINVDLSDETTSIAYLIPKTTGRGCCTTALVDHLVMIHNEFIDICMKIIKEMHATGRTWKSVWRDPLVQIKDLRDTQLLQYENRLMAVILAHCHYSLTVGQQHTDVEYDYAALEKHLLNEFVYGKPKIQLDIPHVVFRKDVYTGERFEMIRTKVPQIPLSAAVRKDILIRLTMIQQLRQALDHIDVVMGFLSAGGKENPNMSLNHYATKVLKIQDFNKVIGTGYCIGHILALWDVVAVELARKITLTGVVPYSVNDGLQQHLPTDVVVQMNEDLEHVNLDVVLSTLNDFIETHVRNINEADHRMEWTIKECLEGHLGFLPGKYELEKEIKFLREIPMSQVIGVWKAVVFYKKRLESESQR